MKKFKINNLKAVLTTVLLSALLFSCSEDENPTTDPRVVKPVVTANQTSFTLAEGASASVTLTVDNPYYRDMNFKLELVGGTGSFRDYVTSGDETIIDDGYGVIGHKINFPAYASTATFDITPIFDLLPEGTETFEFRLYPMGNGNGLVAPESEMITMSVSNTTSNDFVAVVDWAQSYTDAHGTILPGEYVDNTAAAAAHEYCDFDFDLEIYDAAFNVVDDSYSSCPEMITFPATAPDGTYYIVPSLWTTVGPTAPKDPNMFFKVKVTMAKPGIWNHEVNIDNIWKYNQGGAVQNNPLAYQIAGVLVKTGNSYVLSDEDNNVLASGRIADFKLKTKKFKK